MNPAYRPQRSGIIATLSLWRACLGALIVSSAGAQVLTESFTGSTAPGWVFGGTGYTPTLTSGTIDPSGEGWLRMTPSSPQIATYAYNDTAFDSANQTIYAEFDYASYNGSGADGITFFLFDGSASFSVGANGGSMGYAQKDSSADAPHDGLAGGYLGISLDDWGNFTNATEGREGGIGQYPNNVSVRGPGSGQDGYEYLASATNLPAQLDFPSDTSRPDPTGADYRHVAVLLTPTNQLSVYLQIGASGELVEVLTADLSGYARPETLKLGFTSGTGDAYEIHELRNTAVTTLTANLWDNGDGTSTWGTNNNWNPDAVPNLSADILLNNAYVSTAQTIDVGTTRTIRGLNIDAPFSYTLNNGTLNFEDSGVPGFVGILATGTNGAANHTINSALTFQDAGTIRNSATGTTLSLTGSIANNGHALTVDGTADTSISGVISGSGSLTKSGAGELSLSGSNTYTGGTTLTEGTLGVNNANALGSGSLTVTGGTLAGTGSPTLGNTVSLQGDASITGLTLSSTLTQSGGARTLTLDTTTLGAVTNSGYTLTTNVTGDSAISGAISGSGGLTKSGSATLTLGGDNTYSGDTTINEGSLQLGASDRLSDSTNVYIGAAGTLDLAGHSERINDLTATGDGATLDFGSTSGANNFLFDNYTAPASGVLVVTNWEEGLDNLATTVGSQSSITSNGIYFSGYGVAEYNGTAVLYGASRNLLTPVVASSKEWDGSYDNTWTNSNSSPDNNWTTPGEPSTDQIAVFDALGVANSQLHPNLTANDSIAGIRFGSGATASYTISGNSTSRRLTLGGSSSPVPYIQQQSGVLQTIDIAELRLGRSLVVDITGAGDLEIDSKLNDSNSSYALIRDGLGAGKLILGGSTSNTFDGGVFLNNGITEIRKTGALGTGTTTISSGAALELSGGVSPTNAITLGGTGVAGNGAIRNLSGSNTLNGNLTLTGDTRFQSDSGTLTLSGSNALDDSGKNLTFGGSGNITVSKAITTGSGTVTKDGSGTLTFSGTNTYTGTTTVNAGTLNLYTSTGGSIAGNLVIGNGTDAATVAYDATHNYNNQIADTATVTVNSSGVLNLNGKTDTIGGLQGSTGASVTLGTGSLTVSNNVTNDYAGTLSGSGSLTKTGTGRLKLSGDSTGFTGTTALNSGIIAVQNDHALGSGSVTVASGANLELVGGVSLSNNFTINGPGTGAQDGAIENFVGTNTLTGTVKLQTDSRIQSSAGTLNLNGNISNLSGTHNLTFSGAGDTVVNSVIGTGSGTVTKEGSGNLTLAGNNTFTGALAINGGTVTLGANERINNGVAVSIGAAGTLDLDGHTETIRSLSGTGAVDFGGGTLVLGSGAPTGTDTTFGGSFIGAGTLMLTDSDYTLTLGANITDTSLTIQLAGGTLDLGGYTSSFGTLNVTSNSVLDFSGTSQVTFSNITISPGVTLTVTGWSDAIDYFYATNGTNLVQGTNPANQIVFTGFSGSDTKWQNFNNEVTPVPEPAHYGAAFALLGGALLGWHRRRRHRA